MPIIVRSPAELRAALNSFVEEIDATVVKAKQEVATFLVDKWSWGKATWSPRNPDDYWTGQYRSSIKVTYGGNVDGSSTPEHPDVISWTVIWPPDGSSIKNRHPDEPYMPPDIFGIHDMLATVPPYMIITVSNNVLHATCVEDHTNLAHASAEFTKAHFGPGYSWGYLANSDVPF